jgi:hypothetical protein
VSINAAESIPQVREVIATFFDAESATVVRS